MQEPCISVKNLLYAQWTASSPGLDSTTTETLDPAKIHFTNRYWASPPDRIHSYQISILQGSEPNKLIGIGSVLKYKFWPVIPIHCWVPVGTSITVDQALVSMRNMQDEVSRIIKANPSGATDLQIIRLLTGWQNMDSLSEGNMYLHRVLTATGIYYKT